MTTINSIFNLCNRVSAICSHVLVRRANIGFSLQQPFAWSLINTAAVAARLLDEHGACSEQLESTSVRDALLNSEFPLERYDQLVIKMATLRHFNRKASGINEIGMGQINACLRPETPISLEEIQERARDRVKMERRMGRIKPQLVTARFKELVTSMFHEEESRKAQTKRLMDEVFFLCNRSDDMLFVGNYELQLEANHVYQDIQLADFDGFDYLGEGLAEKMVEPVLRAREELQALMDKSYRIQTYEQCTKLMNELTKIGTELGISFAKVEAMNCAVDAEINNSLAVEAKEDAAIDSALNELHIDLCEVQESVVPAPASKRRRVKKEAA